ncbi:MAG: extracellular solute-binding protein [Phycisphaerales bacterium]|nr:extracellular solute-binding protein [Phycisphaerales bacterium]
MKRLMSRASALLVVNIVTFVLALASNNFSVRAGSQAWEQPPAYKEHVFPPWSHGKNNSAVNKGLSFTVPEVDDMPDFHGDPMKAKLVLYIGGNYYFAVGPLISAFEQEHPTLRGRIFAETLPPGILLAQLKAGGRITVGNMTFTARPDVYAAGKIKVDSLVKAGVLAGSVTSYATNDLTIMIPRNNPASIKSLSDLGRPGVRLSMPNPAWEGVARQIKLSLIKAGGRALEQMVYHIKVLNGQTILTHVHHRQTPLFIMQGLVDAGITWKSEAIFQEQAGHPISYVPIPESLNTTAVYAAAVVKGAAHRRTAGLWLEFLTSPAAQSIFHHYGFKSIGNHSEPVGLRTAPKAAATPIAKVPAGTLGVGDAGFLPPPASAMPSGHLGKMTLLGQHIFVDTQHYAAKYVGNSLNCVNCHLSDGREAYCAPMWAAYVAYPRYQAKAGKVVSLAYRIQECFIYSMNGKAPPATGKTITALLSYCAWLAHNAPTGVILKGRGYKKLPLPALPPSLTRGRKVFLINCMQCHSADGQGKIVNGQHVFPPLWGPHSYNMGAGMHKPAIAAAFIKMNMPFGHGNTLSLQQAWDVAKYVDSHPRPADPRKQMPASAP